MEENKNIDINKIECRNLRKVYGDAKKGEAEIVAMKGANFEIKRGELVVILGPSGAGKSTLLNVLGGMDKATSGDYFFFGKEITKMKESELAKFRRNNIGFVFQFYNLMPSLTAKENVFLAASLNKGSFNVEEIMDKVGLKDRMNNFPAQLSGGEQQRVAIARALVKNPDLLLCDEPTGALDSKTGAQILDLLYEICKKNNKTVIIVTHNKAISVIADRLIQVVDGSISKNEVILNPKSAKEIER